MIDPENPDPIEVIRALLLVIDRASFPWGKESSDTRAIAAGEALVAKADQPSFYGMRPEASPLPDQPVSGPLPVGEITPPTVLVPAGSWVVTFVDSNGAERLVTPEDGMSFRTPDGPPEPGGPIGWNVYGGGATSRDDPHYRIRWVE